MPERGSADLSRRPYLECWPSSRIVFVWKTWMYATISGLGTVSHEQQFFKLTVRLIIIAITQLVLGIGLSVQYCRRTGFI